MKRSINVFLGALLTAVVIAACAPAFEPELGTNYTRQTENTKERYFTIVATDNFSSDTPPGPSSLTVQPTTGTIEYQRIRITTTATILRDGSNTDANAFNLYIDPNLVENNIPGIGVYPVSGVSVATDPVTHGAALPYTAVPTGKNTVELFLPLKEDTLGLAVPGGTTKSNQIVLIADPDTVRFNGDGRLNSDEDIVLGEGASNGNEDVYLEYFTVSNNVSASITLSNPLTSNGKVHEPPVGNELTTPATFTYPAAGGGIGATGGTKLNLDTFSDTVGKSNNFGEAIALIKAAYKFERFNHTSESWEPYEPVSALWDSGGTGYIELTFPAARLYDFFRYQVNPYQIVEKSALLGYIHRAGYDQNAGFGADVSGTFTPGAWAYVSVGGNNVITNDAAPNDLPFPLPAIAATDISLGGVPGGYYIDVALASIGGVTDQDLDAGSLTAGNFQVVYLENGTDTGPYGIVDLTNAVFEKLGAQKFRIKLPASFLRVDNINATIHLRIHNVTTSYKKGATPFTVKYFDVDVDGAMSATTPYASGNFPAP
jgi:hypothetical protein